MKKVALALLVLAIAMPAMADVNIGLTRDANVVTIDYECTAGEAVRAFALNVDVNNGGFIVGSVVPNTDDYWVYPTNMTFTIVDGNTVVDEYGSPIAGESNAGGVLEMASLYGENDPCRQDAPPSSGILCTFAIDANCAIAESFTVSLDLNAQRGGVVLEDPDAAVTVNLPSDLVVPCIPPGPACWNCPGQPSGDATGDGNVNIFDLLALRSAYGTTSAGSPHGTGPGQYNCCADFGQNGSINIFDLLTLRANYGTTGLGACSDKSCP